MQAKTSTKKNQITNGLFEENSFFVKWVHISGEKFVLFVDRQIKMILFSFFFLFFFFVP